MANEVEDIVQNVVLAGNEEVAAGFDKIKEAGERAFEAIEHAAEHLTSVAGVATLFTGLAASVAILGVGMFEFVRGTSETVDKLGELSRQAGVSIEDISALSNALAHSGVATGELAQAYRHMSQFIQNSWTDIKKASRDGADNLKKDLLDVQSAEIASSQAQRNLANSERDRAAQQKQNNNSVASARQALDELNAKSLRDAGVDTSALDAQLARQRELIQLKEAQAALDAARRKRADDAAQAEEKAEQAAIAKESADLALKAARNKAKDDAANDVTSIAKAVQNTIAGDENAFDGLNKSADNVAKGILKAAGDGARGLEGFSGSLADFANTAAPGVQATFDKLSEFFHSTDDNALKTAIAMRVFGRTVGQAFIDALSKGPEALKEMTERLKGLGLAADEADEHVAGKFRESLFGLTGDIQGLATKISTAFGPGITTILNAIDTAIVNNRQKFIDLANTVAGAVVPAVESLIRVLSGAATPDDAWIQTYITGLTKFLSALGSVASGVAKFTKLIIESFAAVADDINSVFGTNLNGFDVFVGAFIASSGLFIAAVKLMAGFALIAGGAIATGLGISLLPALAILGELVIAIIAVKGAFKDLSDVFGSSGAEHLDAKLKAAGERFGALKDILSGDVKKGLERWKQAGIEQNKTEDELDKRDGKHEETKVAAVDEAQKHIVEASEDTAKHVSTAHEASAKKVTDAYKNMAKDSAKSFGDLKNAASDLAKLREENPGLNFSEGSTVKGVTPGEIRDVKQELAKRQAALDKSKTGEINENGTQIIDAERQAKIIKDSLHGLNIGDTQFRRAGGDNPSLTDDQVRELQGKTQTPLPRERPLSAGPNNIKEDIAEGFKEGLADLPDSLTPPFSPKQSASGGEFSPSELQPHETFSDLLEPLKPIADFLRNAISNPGALQEKQHPDAETPPQQPVQQDQQQQTSTLQSILEAITSLMQSLETKSTDGTPTDQNVSGNADQIDSAFQSAASGIESGAQAVVSALETAAASIAAAAQGAAAAASSGNVATAASGGYITGPGTTTSDSIWARLSNQEYVHKAQAVAHYGVDFMHAINNMQVPKFALGGMVGMLSPSLPRFAAGGLVTAGSGLMMQPIPVDLRTDHGTIRATVDGGGLRSLRRAAVMKNMGKDKQPTWVK